MNYHRKKSLGSDKTQKEFDENANKNVTTELKLVLKSDYMVKTQS